MAIELCGLSGSRQGETFRFPSQPVSIGDDEGCDIVFSRRKDAAAKGKRLEIVQNETGWQIHNTGKGIVYLNQNVVPYRGTSPIRSGDIIRLSEMGPDFSFSIVADPAPSPLRASPPAAEEAKRRDEREAMPANHQEELRPSQQDTSGENRAHPSVAQRKSTALRQALVAVLVGSILASLLIVYLILQN